MNGEDITQNYSLDKSNMEVMLHVRLQSIARLQGLALHDMGVLREAEQSAMGLMRSDEGDLLAECRAELAKAKLLLRKKFPVRYSLSVIKSIARGLFTRHK